MKSNQGKRILWWIRFYNIWYSWSSARISNIRSLHNWLLYSKLHSKGFAQSRHIIRYMSICSHPSVKPLFSYLNITYTWNSRSSIENYSQSNERNEIGKRREACAPVRKIFTLELWTFVDYLVVNSIIKFMKSRLWVWYDDGWYDDSNMADYPTRKNARIMSR